jgi:hypothetical protein
MEQLAPNSGLISMTIAVAQPAAKIHPLLAELEAPMASQRKKQVMRHP